MIATRYILAIEEWFEHPIVIHHPNWYELPPKWATRSTDLTETEAETLYNYVKVYCAKHNIASMPGSMVGDQYPLEVVRHVCHIVFGYHRRTDMHRRERHPILQDTGQRTRLPEFVTYPAPHPPNNKTTYQQLNKLMKLPQKRRYTTTEKWLREYSHIKEEEYPEIEAEAKAYCHRFNIPTKGVKYIPKVLRLVHDTIWPETMRKGRKRQERRIEYIYPGYNEER